MPDEMMPPTDPDPSPADGDYDVFISYAHDDRDWVRRLAENLHRAGLRVFLDAWEIAVGDVVSHELDRGLRQARNGILVVSPSSLRRPWVQEEYAALLEKAVTKGGRLIPVLLADAEMPPMLATRKWVDFRGRRGDPGSRRGGQEHPGGAAGPRPGREGWLVASLAGEIDADGVLDAVGRRLHSWALDAGCDERDRLRQVAAAVRRPDVDQEERLELLGEHVLGDRPLVVLLDNFEDNLSGAEDAAAFRNPQLAALLSRWLGRPGRSRVLITCRYRVTFPGVAGRLLHDHHLGPLSLAETRKLLWRLPGVDALPVAEQERAWTDVGGHPRALEYLDALVRGGEARFADVAERMEAALARKGIAEPQAWLAGRGGGFDQALDTGH